MRKVETQVPGQQASNTPVDDGHDAGMVSVNAADLQRLMDKVEGLQAQISARDTTSAQANAALPDQSTVDPAAIDRAVLTRQGWVVPLKKGAPPVGARV